MVSVRNLFFDKGIFKQTSHNIPVLAVGNLSVGGTGKTPQIEYYIRLFKNEYTIAVLSRGYKRASKGFVLATKATVMNEIGDEPFQYYKKFPNIMVAVDSDRVNGINRLLQENPSINLILLDDAYQHRKVKASCYTLLTAYSNRYTKDFVLPLGNLREVRSGAKRADAIIVTKCPNELPVYLRENITKEIAPLVHQKVFFSKISYDNQVISNTNAHELSTLKEYSVLLVTGIAKPKPLLDFLEDKGINFKHIEFPDHHNFASSDVEKITKAFEEIDNSKKLILTTEKDFTRLSNKIENVYSLGIKTTFLEDHNEFDAFVRSQIENYKPLNF